MIKGTYKIKVIKLAIIVTSSIFLFGCIGGHISPTTTKRVEIIESVDNLKLGVGNYVIATIQDGLELTFKFLDAETYDLDNPIAVYTFDVSDYKRLGPTSFLMNKAPSIDNPSLSLSGTMSTGSVGENSIDHIDADLKILSGNKVIIKFELEGYY